MIMKIKKLTAGLLLLVMMAAAMPGQMFTSLAATGKITFSDPSVTVGNQVSVTMKISSTSGEGLGASDVMLEYDSSMLEFVSGTSANGGAGSVRVLGTMESEGQTSFSFTLKFKALQAGTTSVKVKSQEVYDSNSQTVSISHVGSSAVKVNAPATYSKEASLSSLEISPGTLSPAFSADVTDYTATVSGDVEKVTVSAPAKDSKARVVVSGNDNLQMGENTIVCKVTAEDGETVKNYTITVTKTEEPVSSDGESDSVPADANAQGSGMTVTVGETTWQVSQSFDEAALPEGFVSADYQYSGMTIQSGYKEDENLRLLYMTNESGDGDFFLYDEGDQTFAPYVIVKMAEKTVIVLPVEQMSEDIKIPEDFVKCTIDIGTHSVEGWIWRTTDGSTPEYCVVYGMNSSGERGLYRYDQKEMTLQRYFQDPAAESTKEKLVSVANDYNSLLEDYKVRGWIMAGLFAVCILLVIILIVLLLTRKPRGPKDRGYRETEEDYYNYTKPAKTGAGNKRAPKREEYLEDDDDYYEEDRRRGADRGGLRDDFGYEEEQIEDLDEEFDEPEVKREPPVRRTPAAVPKAPKSVADVERDIAVTLAKEADRAASSKKTDNDDDDFEFIDLDL